MKAGLVTMLTLGLAACSSPDTSSVSGNDSASGNEVAPIGAAAAPEVVTPVASPAPAPSATPKAQATTFPAAFRGRWGMNANDCDPKRDDNKGLITVSADAIKFYESRAKLSTLTVSTPTRIGTDLAFNGEGQTWQSRTVFELEGGGKTLIRAEESDSYTYTRCPA